MNLLGWSESGRVSENVRVTNDQDLDRRPRRPAMAPGPAGCCLSTGCRRSRPGCAPPCGGGSSRLARSTCRTRWPRCRPARPTSGRCASSGGRSWTCPGPPSCCPLPCWPGEAEVRASFQAARNDEYEEIVDKCEDFLRQVQKEYDENHFTYAELEENEDDLVKLQELVRQDRRAGRLRRQRTAGHRAGARDVRAVARGVRRPGLRRGGGGPVRADAVPSPAPPCHTACHGTSYHGFVTSHVTVVRLRSNWRYSQVVTIGSPTG